jgi:pimeloyl-ACP methyl ester carboxylesterase
MCDRERTMWTDGFVDSDGVRIAVRDFGGVGAPIVLVHGHYGNLANFDELGPLLAQDYRVVTYDQRGQGWSESGPVSIDTFNADLDTVIGAYGLQRPWLFGSSFGALVALGYVDAGRAVAGLVIEDGAAADFASGTHDQPAPPDGPTRVSPDTYQQVVDGYVALGAVGEPSAVRSAVRCPDGSYVLRPSRAELHAKESAYLNVPVMRTYATVADHTLFLAAEGTDAEALAAKGVTIERFETGHWISAADPEGVARATVAFMRAHA